MRSVFGMTRLTITSGEFSFEATFEFEDAPNTCGWFQQQLPFRTEVIHARWSGEAVWMPLGDLESGLAPENHTIHPSRGDVLFYPGGISEAEILLAYGASTFASRAGALSGNHFITLLSGKERLLEFGSHVLWHGAQDIEFAHSG